MQSKRFIDYAPTSLERNYKYELLTEHDLGVHVDLILPEAYEKPEEQVNQLSKTTPNSLKQFPQSRNCTLDEILKSYCLVSQSSF